MFSKLKRHTTVCSVKNNKKDVTLWLSLGFSLPHYGVQIEYQGGKSGCAESFGCYIPQSP